MFKVLKFNKNHNTLPKFLKQYKGDDYVYIKDKYITKEVVKNDTYELILYFAQYKNDNDKNIIYIGKVSIKPSDYKEQPKFVEYDSDDD